MRNSVPPVWDVCCKVPRERFSGVETSQVDCRPSSFSDLLPSLSLRLIKSGTGEPNSSPTKRRSKIEGCQSGSLVLDSRTFRRNGD